MDLGFARRRAATNRQTQDSLDLATLLAEIAARQSVSPTAQAMSAIETGSPGTIAAHPETEFFAPRHGVKANQKSVASFSPEVASAMHTSRKPF
ncbi:MAG: hypothetical protein ACKVOJ_11065 [Sphingomonadaceae bacterium]